MNTVINSTQETPKSKSKENQAKLNNAQWLSNYRELMTKQQPEVSPVSMQDNISVALRDPVYGQATATGLAAGQSLLNSWIAGANAKAKQEADKLANERWIKAQQDLADERDLRRKELEESKKQVVQAPGYTLDAFKESTIRSNPKLLEAYNRLNTTHVGRNPEEAAQIQNQMRLDRQMLDAAQESIPLKMTSSNPKAIDSESTGGFMNMGRRFLNTIPGYRRLALTGDERALANVQTGMEKAGYKTFSSVSPEYLLKEAQNNIESGNVNTGVQQRKVAQVLGELLKRPGYIAKQSPDGSVIVVSGPNQSAITLTPGTINRYAKKFGIDWK